MGYFKLKERNKKAVLASNIITTLGADSLTDSFVDDASADWTYMSVGLGTNAPGSADTKMYKEIYRLPITGRYEVTSRKMRLVGVFGAQVACGDWTEIGVFDRSEVRSVLSSCSGTASFLSDGSVTQETSAVHEGVASIRTQMDTSGTLAFRYSGGSTATHTQFASASTYLQFWYRSSLDPGTLTVKAGTSASDYYQWSWAPGTTGVYSLFHQAFSSGSATGVPVIGSTFPFKWFEITHPSGVGATYYEYLDYISVYSDNGILMARGTISKSKSWNTTINAYYTLDNTT